MTDPPRPRAFRRPLVLALAAFGAAAHLFGLAILLRHGAERKLSGWSARSTAGVWRVAAVSDDGPAHGLLLAGDRILAVAGDDRGGLAGPLRWWAQRAPGEPYAVTVERGGQRHDVVLRLVAGQRAPSGRFYLLTVLLAAAAFLGTALVLIAKRGEDALTSLAALSLYLSAFTMLRTATQPVSLVLTETERLLWLLIPSPTPIHLALSFAFFRRFPGGVPDSRALRLLERFFLASSVVLWIAWDLRLRALHLFGPFQSLEALRIYPVVDALSEGIGPANLVGFTAIVAALVRSYRHVTEPSQIRRLRWVTFGSLAGIVPYLVYYVVTYVPGASEGLLAFLERFANFALLVVPIATGYAIVKHRLFDIEVVVRRGLRYVFARNVLRVAVALPLAALAVALWTARDRPLGEILFETSGLLWIAVAATLALAFRRRVGRWIDRRFFRAAYDRERLLVGLAENVAKLDSLSEISRMVHRELEAALHPRAVLVVAKERGRLGGASVAFASGELSAASPSPESFRLLERLEGEASAMNVPIAADPLPEGERAWLAAHAIALAVPMSGSDGRLLGALLLGEKRSEEPYGAEDKRLLVAVASQMAVVYENLTLRERVRDERRARRSLLDRVDPGGTFVRECPACGLCQDGSALRCPNDGEELAVPVPVDRILDGRYRLDRILGRGGMGAVYEALDTRLDRNVAVKVVVGPLFAVDRSASRRFEREARASARLHHPNIVAVFDYGTIAQDGAYLVMELIRGVTLRQELRRRGTPEPAALAGWVDELLAGVEAAHAAGVVHRDLKPENVLLAGRNGGKDDVVVKILDFGLARVNLLDLTSPSSLTFPGTVVGTLGYMSPEQLSGEAVDARSDIFSLGVLVAELLTGRVPFRGASMREVMAKTLSDAWRLPGEGPEARAVDAVLQRCLAKLPEDRFTTVSELRAALVPVLRVCPRLAPAGVDPERESTPTQEITE